MARLLRVLAAGVFLVGTAGTVRAELLRWEGTLSLELRPLGTVSGVGGAFATVNGPAGLGHLTTLAIDGGITGGGTVLVTDPWLAPLISLRGSMTLGSGVLRPISGGVQSTSPLTENTLPVQGLFKGCITFGNCNNIYLPIPFTQGGTAGVGIGGLLTVNGFGPGIHLSVFGAPWTVKTAVVTGIPTENGGFSATSAFGFVHGPASLTSSTANVSGVVQLVTPAKVVTTLGPGTVWPLFGVLTIHFVPEPSTIILVGGGLGLLALGRRRRRL